MTKHLETIITESLLPGSKKLKNLVEIITYSSKVSPQAVYKSVRKLKENETVTIYNKQVALSLVWIKKQKEKFAFAEYSYKASKDILSRLTKSESKASFHFSTYAEMDLFWAHIYDIVSENLKTDYVRYFCIPHDFFLYGRYETDAYWITQFFNKKSSARFILTHPLSGDTAVVKERRKSLHDIAVFHMNVNPLHQNSNVYFNILGEYVFKATFDITVKKILETFIATVKKLPLTQEEEKEISNILSMKGIFILTVENNYKKLQLWKRN